MKKVLRGGSQPAFTCSNLTIETLERGVKYGQSLVFPLLSLNKYMPGGRLATLFKKRLTVFEFLSREYILLSSI